MSISQRGIMKKLGILNFIPFLILLMACGGGGGGGGDVVVIPPPSITSFSAASPTINAGQSTTLTAVFSNGTGTVTGGPTPVSIVSGVPISVTPTSTTTYTLTVSNTAGASGSSTATVTVNAPTQSLSYVDPTTGTYRLIKNTSLSTSTHLVLDLVSTDSQSVSGIGFNIAVDNSKVSWVKVVSSDSTLVQNGNIFNLGSSPQILYAKAIAGSSSSVLSAALALKGSNGVAVNGAGGVLARIAVDPLTTAVAGVVSLTLSKAQAKVQGVSNPTNITITAGTLTLN